ncbi:DEAD/DEAH box helicase domain protein [Magnetococcus marinus MC-1]|uniref:DEAD/DEAH box helicase domain protein n=1 Tax=Magnetococcus marinus (strain ATCC BAA-1437 / JCM 17883 / MC-1) TaxID=156889 RepID=A0LD66_MAGMM|nr:DEAD/DEAH box helicase [Magnetococcus marinus]ABK45909.1 DEAD/DEAH box helicase domain protein [Magnetococcus marinus MC-1]
MEFTELPIPEPVLAGIRDCGFTQCTPIQALTLPLALAGKDVAGQAQTGTGKTAAFLIGALSHLVTHPRKHGKPAGQSLPRILAVAPTRELVAQIESDAKLLNAHTQFKLHCVYGGVDYEKQKRILMEEDVEILVGTPGRLIDYFKQNAYGLKGVEVLIVDEADRMFDMGFIDDLRYMLRRLPHYSERLSMLFSATLSYRAQEMSYEYMNMPEVLSTTVDVKTAERVEQKLYHVSGDEKIALLVGLLRDILQHEGIDLSQPAMLELDDNGDEIVEPNGAMLSGDEPSTESEPFVPHPDDLDTEDAARAAEAALANAQKTPPGRSMVFVNTKRAGERVERWLKANGIQAGYLSGDVPQMKRLKVLKRFQDGEYPVLIATDVAGRGLHIDGVTHVINYDLPDNAEDYVHRIGRTARAGNRGDAIALVDEEGAYSLEAVQAYIGMTIPIVWAEDDLFADLVRPPPRPRSERDMRRTGGGRSGSGGSRSGSGGGRAGSGGSRSGSGSRAGAGRAVGGSRSTAGGVSQGAKPSHHTPAAAAHVAVPAGSEGGGEAVKKKRRRRRRKPGVQTPATGGEA